VTLPPEIPLFPLPNVVFFPDVYLPLHIFEQRYRAMTRQALGGTGVIGMTVLRDGWQDDYEGTPPIYATGCAGAIVHHESLDDGRLNIVLRGLARFEVQQELSRTPETTAGRCRGSVARWRHCYFRPLRKAKCGCPLA
jgi:Lon protease-like protein